MEVPAGVYDAFGGFLFDSSLFTLPLKFSECTLVALPAISFPGDSQHTFQQALNQLNPALSTKLPLYLILRHSESLVLITYVPYLADVSLKTQLLNGRNVLIEKLGKEHFFSSIICKEIGEIMDARSWDERSGDGQSWRDSHDDHEHTDACEHDAADEGGVKDLGHKKNKCRLCDRRMTNRITDDALNALKSLADSGDCSVSISTEMLRLNFQSKSVAPSEVASHISTENPSFTFYRHVSNNRLYFIFHSPDNAAVKERMKHTMAIPGLINVIAKDNGVNVDQKLEIHDPDDLEFDKKDERIGKFRSMYLRNDFAGTESQWDGMEDQQRILDTVR